MSVRHGLLSVLTLGPAYGLQLHGELLARAAHRGSVNVGQIYGTLERLLKQERIRRAGSTSDGLPLYALTPAGNDEALAWLTGTAPLDSDWTEMLDRVLISSTVPAGDPHAVIDGYLRHWTAMIAVAGDPETASATTLADAASAELAGAALRWLARARDTAATGTLVRPLTVVRPRRGRPAASVS
ncbi:PadR family transcriptional regulator [Amnibacterium flavum]|uniref:PadR family transcriptional regulator n=1 Tax=Amnibacterium flavum TaxID=2173173 RepID=A0A2V1HVM1_9MICO|nr:helix-turn-helix transcriptional regulator [Amnibacterium flavum]PVZ94204.1 PadR family transcriptional regulator [Amnibacterium flavum]